MTNRNNPPTEEALHHDLTKEKIIHHFLHHLSEEGWTLNALSKAIKEAGFLNTDVHQVFQGGVRQALDFYFQMVDRQMLEELKKIDLKSMRLRDRIITGVMIRFKLMEPHKGAVKKTMRQLTHPSYGFDGMRFLFRTIDHLWYAAGDQSTDFNYYSKRALLAGVYLATTLKWVQDDSFDHLETRAFLDQRIEQILLIPTAQKSLASVFSYFCSSFGFGSEHPPFFSP